MMELLTKEIRAELPALGSQENAEDPIAHVKFFTPDGGWTWYATECSPEGNDFVFFGYVEGIEDEWGTFSLSELKSVRGVLGLPVERDLHFRPCPVSQFIRRWAAQLLGVPRTQYVPPFRQMLGSSKSCVS